MKTVGKITGNQIREFATKLTGRSNDNETLFFVQLDDFYAVANDGCIYQIITDSKDSFLNQMEEGVQYISYISESGNIYNYAEDDALNLDEDSLEIYNHCLLQSELSFDNEND